MVGMATAMATGAGAGAALLRSVATKMARVPKSSGGFSRFSTSTGGSMPPSANLRGPQTDNKEFPSRSQKYWYMGIVVFNEAVSVATFFLFGGFAIMHFSVNPALDRIQDNMDAQHKACVTLNEELETSHERKCAALLSNKESQIEATDVSEDQWIKGNGTK